MFVVSTPVPRRSWGGHSSHPSAESAHSQVTWVRGNAFGEASVSTDAPCFGERIVVHSCAMCSKGFQFRDQLDLLLGRLEDELFCGFPTLGGSPKSHYRDYSKKQMPEEASPTGASCLRLLFRFSIFKSQDRFSTPWGRMIPLSGDL